MKWKSTSFLQVLCRKHQSNLYRTIYKCLLIIFVFLFPKLSFPALNPTFFSSNVRQPVALFSSIFIQSTVLKFLCSCFTVKSPPPPKWLPWIMGVGLRECVPWWFLHHTFLSWCFVLSVCCWNTFLICHCCTWLTGMSSWSWAWAKNDVKISAI